MTPYRRSLSRRSEDPVTIPKDPDHVRPYVRFENRSLFAGGARLLQQEMLRTPHPAGFNAYSVAPTSRLRILDTGTGRVVVETGGAPVGAASRVFCSGSRARVVISGDGLAHLIDLGTLRRIASASIPVGRHFVF